MSLLKDMKTRSVQKKANNFIESLKNKSEKEIEQAYLDNKEFENNEIVLSYLFFNHVSLIRILPLEFQKSRINSNLNMFKFGSEVAKKELVVSWMEANKFFMNALVVGFDEEEFNSYLKLYFQHSDYLTLLFMEDLEKVIKVLSESDLKQTEEVIEKNKDKFTDKQWEFIIEVNPIFIKYAPEEIQNQNIDDEKYSPYLSGVAREKYLKKQLDKIKENISLLDTANIEVQKEYINEYPYMINYLKEETLINLLKYDIDLIKYVNLSIFKNENDKTQEVVCGILENLESKTNKEIVNILVNKCLLNAKGKLYRFDSKSNNVSYQYTKRVIRLLQKLSVDQISTLILVDSNYILPYAVPVYNDDTSIEEKEKIVVDANLRCLNVFKHYYGEELYNQYYKVINKIYNEYLANIIKYDYGRDYRCIFELLKVLFNKNIMLNNNFDRVSLFIGNTILHKDDPLIESKQVSIKLLNDLLSKAYNKKIYNNKELFNINSLELFDDKLSFIDSDLLLDYSKYNFVNISNLLLIIKSDKVYPLFKTYYEIVTYINGKNKETLYKIIENFYYYKDVLKDVEGKELNDDEINNLVVLLSTYINRYNITKKADLDDYDITVYKKLVNEISSIKNEEVYKNLICNYLFNKGYNEKGNSGWLDVDTIKSICDTYEVDSLRGFESNGKEIFTEEEINLFSMTKLLFSTKDFDLLLSFIENVITNNVKRNIISITKLFNKIMGYKVDLINKTIVSLDEIKELYIDRPEVVMKNNKDGIEVYTIVGQDFKVLYSLNNDGINYRCENVSQIEKNAYAYNRINGNGTVRFKEEDGKNTIKYNKDSIDNYVLKPDFIIVTKPVTDELLSIAKENELTIVEIENE